MSDNNIHNNQCDVILKCNIFSKCVLLCIWTRPWLAKVGLVACVFCCKSTDLQFRTTTVLSLSLRATVSLDVPITPFHYQRPTLSNKEVKCIAMCCAHLRGLALSCAFSCMLLNKYMDSG